MLQEIEVLLVEDNPYDAELTLTAFRKSNLANRIHHVKDGAEALQYLFGTGAYTGRNLENQPRLMLLDLKLPKVDGLEVLRAVRTDDRTRFIPIVILTSSREERDIIESYRLGVNSYIVKPVDFDKFTQAVSDLGFYWLLLNRAPEDDDLH